MSATAQFRKAPKALLIDIDNTLYRYDPCHRAGLESAARSCRRLVKTWCDRDKFLLDYQEARSAVKRRLGRCAAAHSRLLYFKEMVERRVGRADFSITKRLEYAYWSAYGNRMIAERGSREFLRMSLASGVRLAWISNHTTARQIWKLQRLRMYAYANTLVTSEEAGAEKPDPAAIDLALDRLGIRPADTWFIGDSREEDVAAARARNIFAILLERNGHDKPCEGCLTVRCWREIYGLLNP